MTAKTTPSVVMPFVATPAQNTEKCDEGPRDDINDFGKPTHSVATLIVTKPTHFSKSGEEEHLDANRNDTDNPNRASRRLWISTAT
jgi:hypothetical protein